jgi:tripartite-type tricarboxylate transporter receptor subunit TctC
MKDFTNLALLGSTPNVLITGNDTGWKSLKDFVAAAKANPGKLNFSSAGIGQRHAFQPGEAEDRTRHRRRACPVQGHARGIGDTIGGRVCCYWAPLNAALPHVNGGKAVALAVSSAKRTPLLPNVPTVAEQGYPGFEYTLWLGLWGPAGLPADLSARINKDVNAALASADLRERLLKLGTEPGAMSIAEFTEYVRKEIDDTQAVLKAAGIKPQ